MKLNHQDKTDKYRLWSFCNMFTTIMTFWHSVF